MMQFAQLVLEPTVHIQLRFGFSSHVVGRFFLLYFSVMPQGFVKRAIFEAA